MNKLQWKHIAIIIIGIAAILVVWMGRFDIVPVGDYAYKLDRWTGNVEFLRGLVSRAVTLRD